MSEDESADEGTDNDSAMAEDLAFLACSVCQRSDDDANMHICDGCSEGYHVRCAGLEAVPATAVTAPLLFVLRRGSSERSCSSQSECHR